MRIVLLVSAFNSLTQAIFTALKSKGDLVGVVYAIEEKQILKEIKEIDPDLVLAPFLKRYIPPSIHSKWPIYLLHPGPRGDRGAYSLEHALKGESLRWGAVWMRITDILDGGDIYAETSFKIQSESKSSLYRYEVTRAAVDSLSSLFENLKYGFSVAQYMNPLHSPFLQRDRAIDWKNDDTETIIKKINISDSHPGVLDEIAGVECYLFGAHREDILGKKFSEAGIKQVIAKRDGAVCLKTVDGALWISHLKAPGEYKLPATYLLKDAIKGVKESRISLVFDRSYQTFHEIWSENRDGICYLHFNFHNGAMSSDQCIRLKYAFEYLKESAKVIVLCGGEQFFSNGIHLNILQESRKKGEDGWSNINAMNDLITTIVESTELLTVASLKRSAGAGGVFLALACDFVVASDLAVLNPHYKTMGLSGSELHSYTLPLRVGDERAKKILDEALPIGAKEAENIGLTDKLYSYENYDVSLHQYCSELIKNPNSYFDLLDKKEKRVADDTAKREEALKRELKNIYPEFWDENSEFHTRREEFVYKRCPTETPTRFKELNKTLRREDA